MRFKKYLGEAFVSGKKGFLHVIKDKDGSFYVMHSMSKNQNFGGQILKKDMKQGEAEAFAKKMAKGEKIIKEGFSVKSLTSHMPQDFMSKKYLKGPVRNKINKEINQLLKPTYFDSIPLKDIFKILEKHGVVPLQEDATYWSGFLTGGTKKTEIVYFNLGWKNFADTGLEADGGRVKYPNQHGQYMVIPNAVLSLSYFKMPSGRYEVIAYVS